MKITALILCLFCVTKIVAVEPGLPGKKEIKEVSRIFGVETEFKRVRVSEETTSLQTYLKEGDAVFEVIQDEQVLGYLLSTQTKGRFDMFDYSVIYSRELKVLSMIVLVYRSTHGASVCSKNWLKQFNGYSGGTLELGKDIDSITGATFSATSLVKDIERCYLLMHAVKNTELTH